MASSIKKKTGLLTYPGTNVMYMPTGRDMWPRCPLVKDLFCAMAIVMSLDATPPLESTEEDKDQAYQTLFGDHREGEGIVINP